MQILSWNRFGTSRIEKTAEAIAWLWFLSWFAILASFLNIGVSTCRGLISEGKRAGWNCAIILVITTALWIALFYFFGNDKRENAQRRFFLVGSLLGVLTLLGFFFFVYVSSKLAVS